MKGLKKHSKKEIKEVFLCFGPILNLEFNGMSVKTIITFDLENFDKERNLSTLNSYYLERMKGEEFKKF